MSITIETPATQTQHPVSVPRTVPPRQVQRGGVPPRIRRSEQRDPFGFHCLSRPTEGELCNSYRPCAGWKSYCKQSLPAVPPVRPTRRSNEALILQKHDIETPVCDPPVPYRYGETRGITHMAKASHSGSHAPQKLRLLQHLPSLESAGGEKTVDVTREQWMIIVYLLGGLLLLVASILAIVYR